MLGWGERVSRAVYLNLDMHTHHLAIVLKCRLYFSRSG